LNFNNITRSFATGAVGAGGSASGQYGALVGFTCGSETGSVGSGLINGVAGSGSTGTLASKNVGVQTLSADLYSTQLGYLISTHSTVTVTPATLQVTGIGATNRLTTRHEPPA
jgi:hypothetical protein